MLGIHTENGPTKGVRPIQNAAFSTAAIICHTERKFKRPYKVSSMEEKELIFGRNINPLWYGSDCILGYFLNSPGDLYIKSYVGNDGNNIDATVARTTIKNGAGVNLLDVKAAFQGEAEYGESGNRTGVKVTHSIRKSVPVAEAASIGSTFLKLYNVIDIVEGDIIKVGTSTAKVTAIDFGTKTITLEKATTVAIAASEVIDVMAFNIKVYRKDLNGNVVQVDKSITTGIDMLTVDGGMFIGDIMKSSAYIDVVVMPTPIPTTTGEHNYLNDLPAETVDVVWLSGGSDGTPATTPAQWKQSIDALEGKPFRIVCNPETVKESVQSNLEERMRGREDQPVVVINIQGNRTKRQLIELGNSYQRNNDFIGAIYEGWLKIVDPFSAATNIKFRKIPNVAHVMGVLLKVINQEGIHCVPTNRYPIAGVEGVWCDVLEGTDAERTEVAKAGVNLIRHVQGRGYILRNSFTPSLLEEFKNLNVIFMRNLIKISCKAALIDAENEPNTAKRLDANRNRVFKFMRELWKKGSTGNVDEGETFGTYKKEDGSHSKMAEHVEVVADATNNSYQDVRAGKQEIAVAFGWPSPTTKLITKVSVML